MFDTKEINIKLHYPFKRPDYPRKKANGKKEFFLYKNLGGSSRNCCLYLSNTRKGGDRFQLTLRFNVKEGTKEINLPLAFFNALLGHFRGKESRKRRLRINKLWYFAFAAGNVFLAYV